MPPEQLTLGLFEPRAKPLPDDPQAAAELVAREALDHFGINGEWKGSIKVKNIQGGRFMSKTHNISIPRWTWRRGPEYFRYYVVHEVTHAAELLNSPQTARSTSHSSTFKDMEEAALDALYDMKIIRRRVYPKRIIQRGKTVWMEE